MVHKRLVTQTLVQPKVGKEGRVVAYKPSTSTSYASYVRVLMEDGTTRTFRPAEVKKFNPEASFDQLEDTRDGQVYGDF